MAMTDLSAPRPRTDRAAFALSALAAVFWGTNFEATHLALASLPPWSAAGLRFAIAGAAILGWLALAQGIRGDVLRRNLAAFVALGIIGVAGFNAALFVGLQTSSPVTGALIMATSPLTTTLIASGLDRRAPSRRVLAGLVVSLIGVALTIGAFRGVPLGQGDLLILGGSLVWALYTIGCRRWIRDATPLETSAWTMAFGALALIGAALTLDHPLAAIAAATPLSLGAVVYMAIVGSVLAYLFWQTGIAVRGPGPTSVLFNLVPVAALGVAAALGTMPSADRILGVAIAILGVMLASPRPARH